MKYCSLTNPFFFKSYADMQKRATHATQGRGNFYIIAEISSTIGAKWMFSIKTRPLLCLK